MTETLPSPMPKLLPHEAAKPTESDSSVLDKANNANSNADKSAFDSMFGDVFTGTSKPIVKYVLFALSCAGLFLMGHFGPTSAGKSMTFPFILTGLAAGISLSPLRFDDKGKTSTDNEKSESHVRGALALVGMGLIPAGLAFMNRKNKAIFSGRMAATTTGVLVGHLIGHVLNSYRYETVGSVYQPLQIHVAYIATIFSIVALLCVAYIGFLK